MSINPFIVFLKGRWSLSRTGENPRWREPAPALEHRPTNEIPSIRSSGAPGACRATFTRARFDEYGSRSRRNRCTSVRCRRNARGFVRVGVRIVPSHRALRVLDAQPLQFSRQRPFGRVDGDDTDLNPFSEGRIDPAKLDPSAPIVAVPGRERHALSPELEEKGTIGVRDSAQHGQATARAHLVIDVGSMPPLDEPYGPFEPEVIRPVLPDNQAGAVIRVVVGRAGDAPARAGQARGRRP